MSLQFLAPRTSNKRRACRPTPRERRSRERSLLRQRRGSSDRAHRSEPDQTPAPDPDCTPDFPAPSVETGASGATTRRPARRARDKTYRGSITTTGVSRTRTTRTPGASSFRSRRLPRGRSASPTRAANVFTADFLKDADGTGCAARTALTRWCDPTAVGKRQADHPAGGQRRLHGSTWVYDVTVNPDVTVMPAPSLSKKAENLTTLTNLRSPATASATRSRAERTAGSLCTGVVVCAILARPA